MRHASQRKYVWDELRSGLSSSAAGTAELLTLNNVYYYVAIYSIDSTLTKRQQALNKVSIFNRNT